jgi:aminomethyltransferase
MSDDRRPHLFDVHAALGAKLVPFGGWEMPLHYQTGTVAEHLACRNDAVVFDVSHLGTVRVTGDVFDQLQHVLSNDLRKIAPGRAQYTHLLNERGGVEDDIIVWWVGEREFDVMPNASNTSRVLAAVPGVDVTSERCILAVQGPNARKKVATIDERLAAVRRFHVASVDVEGVEVRFAGTGYTGEDGLEISVPNDAAEGLLARLIASGIQPAGLGARDTLRLEAALPLHGHELSSAITPLEARLGWVVGWDKESFVGREALMAERERGASPLLTALCGEGRQPLREGGTIVVEGDSVGELTSGNYSPILERGIGLGFASRDLAVGTAASVELRGRSIAVEVVKAPFVKKAA